MELGIKMRSILLFVALSIVQPSQPSIFAQSVASSPQDPHASTGHPADQLATRADIHLLCKLLHEHLNQTNLTVAPEPLDRTNSSSVLSLPKASSTKNSTTASSGSSSSGGRFALSGYQAAIQTHIVAASASILLLLCLLCLLWSICRRRCGGRRATPSGSKSIDERNRAREDTDESIWRKLSNSSALEERQFVSSTHISPALVPSSSSVEQLLFPRDLGGRREARSSEKSAKSQLVLMKQKLVPLAVDQRLAGALLRPSPAPDYVNQPRPAELSLGVQLTLDAIKTELSLLEQRQARQQQAPLSGAGELANRARDHQPDSSTVTYKRYDVI